MTQDIHPGFLAVYDRTATGDERYRTVARFVFTEEGERDLEKFLAANTNGHFVTQEEALDDIMTLPTEFALRAMAATAETLITRGPEGGKAKVDNPHFRHAWQVRLIWDEDTDEPGEVIHGGFETEADANDYAKYYPDDEGISDFVVEMVNLVVFH